MCHVCGLPSFMSCNCQQPHFSSSPCNTPRPCGCDSSGCLIKLDATCIIYHKNNNDVTQLDNLDLQNGATLELFMNTVDDYIGQIKASNWSFPILVDELGYTINTLQQFATAVDEQIGLLQHFKGNVTADPSDLNDGDYWFRTDLAAANGLRIRVNGLVRTIPTT